MSESSGLHRLSDQQSLGNYLREAWERRAFAVVVPRQDIRAQNMDTALGQFW
ncbi:MAG TPA: phosphate ABC transporter permease, partial [Actinobacteria bacterium]|nr:phosphate ABC transporter permease [Actinomycetota bacterium]